MFVMKYKSGYLSSSMQCNADYISGTMQRFEVRIAQNVPILICRHVKIQTSWHSQVHDSWQFHFDYACNRHVCN